MSKKTLNLITGVLGGVAAIASALITYFQPSYAPALVAAVGIADTAVVEICTLFVKQEQKNE